jgi:hypothetical protein
MPDEFNEGWTLKSLFVHFTAMLTEVRKAVDVAMESLNKRLDTMNEFRSTITDRDRDFARSDVVTPRLTNHEERLQALERANASDGGRRLNMAAIYAALACAVGVIVAVVVIINVVTGK